MLEQMCRIDMYILRCKNVVSRKDVTSELEPGSGVDSITKNESKNL
jgi:hypothetical protein